MYIYTCNQYTHKTKTNDYLKKKKKNQEGSLGKDANISAEKHMPIPCCEAIPAIDTVIYTARTMQSQDCSQTADLIQKSLLKYYSK